MTGLDILARITITCIRNTSNKCDDDIISIRPMYSSDSELAYTVHHTVGICQSPVNQQHKTVTHISSSEGLLVYLDTLLDLLYYDADPFNEIQFDIPSLPSILIKTSMLDIVKDRILSQLRELASSADAWPLQTVNHRKQYKNEVKVKEEPVHHATPKKNTENVNFRQHLFFDEDNNIVEEYHYEF
jgi:hypothetical protein